MRRFHATPCRSWIIAFAVAGMLNLLFLYMMCTLISKRPPRSTFPEYVTGLDVVRLRQSRPHPSTPSPALKNTSSHMLHKKTITLTATLSHLSMPTKVSFPAVDINPSLPPIDGIQISPSLLSPPSLPTATGIFTPSQLDRPLMVLVKIPPLYPMRARMLGIEGWVKVKFLVDTKGRVKNIKILSSHPPGIFDEVTRQAVSRWRFQVPTVDGTPVQVEVITTIKFKLD